MAQLTGLRSVKLPVTDLGRSLEWYQKVFGVEPFLEFPDEEGVVQGVATHLPGEQSGISLRHNPEGHGMEGLEVMLGVRDHAALEQWCAHLDGLGVGHSPIIDATVGWLLVLHDPDGHELHLYTDARHGLDQGGRKGYGRPVAAG
ncbi:MAG TPA: VOC family protein [Amycolatopsis sp.]|nr:VOC family protein [Amycolatopsis sp.]